MIKNLSAFLSKYYTAAPIKLAYRGMGELFVWLAFGPMAILLAAVGQNVGFHTYIIAGLAVTGLSTLSILLIGQLIDTLEFEPEEAPEAEPEAEEAEPV